MEPVTPGCLCNTQQLGPRVCISFTSKAPPNPNEVLWEHGCPLIMGLWGVLGSREVSVLFYVRKTILEHYTK